LHKQKPIFHLNDHLKLPGSLKRKYAFIFASYNNPCGAAGIPGNLMVAAANPPDIIAKFTSKRQARRPAYDNPHDWTDERGQA
jgi:hypothetical protein